MTEFLLIIATLYFFLIGFIFIEIFDLLRDSSIFEKLAYSWGLGVGCVGLQLFGYALLHIPWNLSLLLLPWTLLLFIVLFKKKNKTFSGFSFSSKRYPFIESALIALILLLVIFVGIEAVLRPVQAWDSWDNWLFRTKIFYTEKTIPLNYFNYAQDEYPIIIPLMATFGYIVMGGVQDRLILFLFFMFYACLGGLFFTTCKKFFSTKKALLLTFLLLSLQNLIRHGGRFEAGQADLPLSYYIFASTMLLYQFIQTRSKKTLLLLSIFLGITGQIKYDGMPFIVTASLITFLCIISWKKYSYIIPASISFLILIPWQVYKLVNHLPKNYLMSNITHVHLNKTAAIFFAMSNEFINIQNWNMLWIVFIVCLFVYRKKLKTVKLFLIILIFQWLAYLAIFLITPIEPATHVKNVIDRIYIHIAPLAVLIIGLLIETKLYFSKKNLFLFKFDF